MRRKITEVKISLEGLKEDVSRQKKESLTGEIWTLIAI